MHVMCFHSRLRFSLHIFIYYFYYVIFFLSFSAFAYKQQYWPRKRFHWRKISLIPYIKMANRDWKHFSIQRRKKAVRRKKGKAKNMKEEKVSLQVHYLQFMFAISCWSTQVEPNNKKKKTNRWNGFEHFIVYWLKKFY